MLHRIGRIVLLSAAAVFLIGMFSLNLTFASPFIHTWDEADFALALDRYDLLAMQPHFPGYPYFIAGARIIHYWVADAAQSLIILNAILALSSAIPITLLARRYVGAVAAGWAAVWVGVTPYLWLMGSRSMSECAGIAVLWWFLWSVMAASSKPDSHWRHVLALFLFSLLMGIRLSYFPFGIAIVFLWIFFLRRLDGSRIKLRRLSLWILIATALQLIWVFGLVLSEGSILGFWKLSQAFVAGHFTEWGGGVAAVEIPLSERFATVLLEHALKDVMLSRSVVVGWLYGMLAVLTGLGVWMLRERGVRTLPEAKYFLTLACCLAAYFVWVIVGQNIEKPRHIAPIAGPLLLMLYLIAVRATQALWRHNGIRAACASLAILFMMICLLSAQAIHGVHLLRQQAEQKPAVYQLHEYLDELDQPIVVYTWEETRVLQVLQPDYVHRRILTLDYFKALADAAPESRVLLTDHVLEGFLLQDASAIAHVTPIAQFESSSLLDPVYARITLYEWNRGKPE